MTSLENAEQGVKEAFDWPALGVFLVTLAGIFVLVAVIVGGGQPSEVSESVGGDPSVNDSVNPAGDESERGRRFWEDIRDGNCTKLPRPDTRLC